jgi:hypothetical protein
MLGTRRISLLALVLTVSAAGCGSGDETIPEENAERLLAQVEGIQADFEEGRCDLVAAQAERLEAEVEILPADVEEDVRDGLSQATSRLADLAADPSQCETPETGATGLSGEQPVEPAPAPEPLPPPEPEEEPAEEEPSDDDGSGPPPSPGGASPETGGVSGAGGGGGK